MSNKLDSKSFKSRIRDLLLISGFIILAAIFSTVLMDIIVYPLTMFATSDVPSYNNLIKLLFAFFFIFILSYYFFTVTSRLNREGHSRKYITIYLLKRPFYYLGLFLFFLALCALIITLVYLMFSSNYYYLHRLSGGA